MNQNQNQNKVGGDIVNDLQHFQSKSRLHFIGQWTNEASGIIRDKIFSLCPQYDHSSFFGEQHIVCHIDMDCFFVNVALTKPENSHLKGKPVCVASGGGAHAEVSSCSYEARQFNVHASMYISEAKKRCPDLQIVHYDFDRVRFLNEMIYKIAFELCPPSVHMKLQVISVDEFFVAFDTRNFDIVLSYCEEVRNRIFVDTNGCTASCGISPNVHVARAATALAKPNGVKLVNYENCIEFVRNLEVGEIHGVGRVTKEKIRQVVRNQTNNNNSKFSNNNNNSSSKNNNNKNKNNNLLPQRRNRGGGNQNQNQNIDNNSSSDSDSDDNDSEALLHNNNDTKILIKDLLSVPFETLRKSVGTAMTEKLRLLAQDGQDHTLVIGTATSDGASIPKAVGVTMNYAIRLNSMLELSSLVLQLCKDISTKLERIGGAATILKLSLLERHPDAPINTTKHLGCGRCNEKLIANVKVANVSSSSASSSSNSNQQQNQNQNQNSNSNNYNNKNNAKGNKTSSSSSSGSTSNPKEEVFAWFSSQKMHDLLFQHCQRVIVVNAAAVAMANNNNQNQNENQNENENNINNEKEEEQQKINNNTTNELLLNNRDNSDLELAAGTSRPILISDIRGITVHASGIVPKKQASSDFIHNKRNNTSAASGKQQISIEAAFFKVKRMKEKQQQQSSYGSSSSSSASVNSKKKNQIDSYNLDDFEDNDVKKKDRKTMNFLRT